MSSSACSVVGWRPAVESPVGTTLSLSSSRSSFRSGTRVGCSPPGHPASSSSSSSSSVEICSSSHKSSGGSVLGGLAPQFNQQKRRIELKRLPVVVQNGKLRFRRNNVKVGDDSEASVWSSTTDAILGAKQTRRDILTRFSSTVGLVVSNFLFNGSEEAAEASVSQRVRLKDVDDQKLQDALRAAVVGDLENAETLFTEIIKEEPESASGWSNRGSVRISLGKYELATNDFTKAIELAPEAPVPYLNRAISYEAVGRYDEAIADCKTAIENDPEEPAAWYNLGNVEARVKDYDTSLNAYQRASILAPGIAGYRLRQALVLFQVGRPEEAKKLLQGLVRKYPNYTEAHAALAAVLWNEGRRSNAEEQFSEATNQEPMYSKISWVENELQWPPAVFEAFSKFLSIDYSKS